MGRLCYPLIPPEVQTMTDQQDSLPSLRIVYKRLRPLVKSERRCIIQPSSRFPESGSHVCGLCKVLIVSPQFHAVSWWSYKASCEVAKVKYPTAPLGLLTVAACETTGVAKPIRTHSVRMRAAEPERDWARRDGGSVVRTHPAVLRLCHGNDREQIAMIDTGEWKEPPTIPPPEPSIAERRPAMAAVH